MKKNRAAHRLSVSLEKWKEDGYSTMVWTGWRHIHTAFLHGTPLETGYFDEKTKEMGGQYYSEISCEH
jgi:hypothetical protein